MDFKLAAISLGCEEAAIKAVAVVESNGNGFIQCGLKTVPKVLFERHVFYKQLAKVSTGLAIDTMSKYPDICNLKTGGYKGGCAEHDRLSQAVAINRTSALNSCSWGAFQIMGYHWETLGYSTQQDFINEMYSDQGQLNAFVKFIKADPRLLKALRAKDWAAFAKAYNGPAYAQNRYDTKMSTEYKKALG